MLSREIISRFEQVVSACSRSRHAFATKAGLNDVAFGDIFRKGNEPRFSTLAAILNAFPQVSAEWLMRGEGDMFRTDGQSAADVSHDGNAPRSVGVENPAKADASLIEQLRKENAALFN